jgi:hypothetical protein
MAEHRRAQRGVEPHIKSIVEMFYAPANINCQGFRVKPYDFWAANEKKLYHSAIKRFYELLIHEVDD